MESVIFVFFFRIHLYTFSACKESSVRKPGISVFSYRTSEICSFLPRRANKGFFSFLKEFKLHENCVINPAHQKVLGAG